MSPSGPPPGRLRTAAPWLLLVLLAAIQAGEHLWWIRHDGGAPLDEDSHDHALRAMAQWWAILDDGGYKAWLWPDYYPPGFFWSAFPWFGVEGPSLEALREAQAPWTAALVLGVGLMVGRSFTPWVGLASAACALTFPMMWYERSRIMLSLPQTGILALALGLLPLPGRSSWPMAISGGLAMCLAVLTHTTNAYAGMAAAGIHLLLGLHMLWRRPEGWTRDLARGTVYWLLAALSIGWYLPSWPIMMEMRRGVVEQYPGTIPFAGILGVLAWFKHGFLYASHAWALLIGALTLPWALRRPLVLVAGAATVAVFYGILSFPQIHERYFLPVAPLLLVLMAAPVGLLAVSPRRPLRWVGHGLAALIGAWGLRFSLTGLLHGTPPDRTGWLQQDGTFLAWPLTNELEVAERALLARPTRWVTYAARPQAGEFPLHGAAAALVADLAAHPGPKPLALTVLGRDLEHDLFLAELRALGAQTVKVRHVRPDELGRFDCDPCYAVFLAPYQIATSEVAIAAANAGYRKITLLSAARPYQADVSFLMLARRGALSDAAGAGSAPDPGSSSAGP